jgi:Type II secretion system (T2SS), protein M subtype b
VSAPLSARDRRVLLIGGAAIALLVLFARGLPAWRRWDAAARADVRRELGREADARAAVAGLRATLDTAEARRDRLGRLTPALLDGESPSAAAATLASILTGAAARAGVLLGAVDVRPDTASGGTFTRVAVHTGVTGDLAGVTELLRYLENVPELLAVREISITQPDAGGTPDRPEALQVELTVQGIALLHLPPDASAAPGAAGGPALPAPSAFPVPPAAPGSPAPPRVPAGSNRASSGTESGL